MARRKITLEGKIEIAQIDVAAARTRYDNAVDELEKLPTKRKGTAKCCWKRSLKATGLWMKLLHS